MGYDTVELKVDSNEQHNYAQITEMYSEPEIPNLDDLKPEHEGSSWRRDEKVNADSKAVSNHLA